MSQCDRALRLVNFLNNTIGFAKCNRHILTEAMLALDAAVDGLAGTEPCMLLWSIWAIEALEADIQTTAATDRVRNFINCAR